MLHSISWFHFGRFLLSTVALYYIIIWVLFYRKKSFRTARAASDNGSAFVELAGQEQTRLSPESPPVSPGPSNKAETENRPPQDTDLYPLANELVEVIDEFVIEAGKKQMVKEELVYGIHKLIEQYPALHQSGFKVAINNYIGIALKNNCPFVLDDRELASLWTNEKKE